LLVARAARPFAAAVVVAILGTLTFTLALAFPRLTRLTWLHGRLHHRRWRHGRPLRRWRGLHHWGCRRHHHRRNDATLASRFALVTLMALVS
jgi:hypothetical protein